jgi:hypothetical protein
MIGLEFDDTIILEQQKVLEAALSTNPKTQKVLQKLIRKVIMEAREKVMQAFPLNDPREAKKSVRTTVYKKILGANINIYQSRKAHGQSDYEPPRKLRPGQRGGNRRPRSARTNTVMHYGPYDRGWILRFHNDGTKQRNIQHMVEIKLAGGGSKFRQSSDGGKYGNRGSIRARHWFKSAGEQTLVAAADNLAQMIDEELENILNKKK